MKTMKLQGRAILVIGDSKQGKSTWVNVYNGISMIGKMINGRVNYVKTVGGGGSQSSRFVSDTTIPNVVDLEVKGKMEAQLVDCGGFNDSNRQANYAVMISYMLMKITEKVRFSKTILTIDHSSFDSANPKSLIDQMTSYFDMYNYRTLDKSQRDVLLRSTYLLITRTENVGDETSVRKYYNLLEGVVKNLHDANRPKANPRISFIIEFLDYMMKNKKIKFFNQAVEGESPKCDQDFKKCMVEDTETWVYMDMNDIKITLPFRQLFRTLDSEEE